MSKLLYEGNKWTVDLIDKTWKAIDKIAKEKYGLEYNTPQIELITSDQMLTKYTTHGMPVMYNHWSFGKSYSIQESQYKKGLIGFALRS